MNINSSEINRVDEFLIPGTDAKVAELYRSLPSIAASLEFGLVEDDVVVLDTETTGLDPARCRLIEIAAVRLSGRDIVGRFETFVDPGCAIPAEITELTGITQADVAGAPSAPEAVAQLAEFAGDCNLVAHNASFDQAFIMRQARPGALLGDWVDTFALAQIALPRFRSHRLADLARAFGVHSPSHRAMDDVESLAEIWRILLAALQGMTPGLAAYIAGLSPQTEWPLRMYFRRAADAMPSIDFSLRKIRSARVANETRKDRNDADEVPLRIPSEEEIEATFSEDGIAGAMYTSYEQRHEQTAMAKEVANAARFEQVSIVEAGTGVGKSMAYLLPYALIAKKNNITMGVATKTNALMDQLVYHELPRLSAALGDLHYIALKGYDHYPCLRKLERMARDSEEDEVRVIQMIAMLLNFTAQTSWGDLDALNIHWAGLPRTRVQANANDCLKKRCPFFPLRCYLHGARRSAASADIVVTNHALLFRDIQADNAILPPIRHWIVDEAHSVESEARRQLSHSAAARELDAALRMLAGSKSALVSRIRGKALQHDGGEILLGATVDITNRVESIHSAALQFFSSVKNLDAQGANGGDAYNWTTLWVGEGLREKQAWRTVTMLGNELLSKLKGLTGRIADLISMLETFEGAFASQQAEATAIGGNIKEACEALKLTLEGVDTSYVYSAQINRDPESISESLDAAKLDIGETLSLLFYPQMKSIVFTSATLATAEKDPFAHFADTTGVKRLAPERVRTLLLSSGYDYDRNMTIFLPSDMPEPNSRDYRAQLAHLLYETHVAMGGSVLTLFTNRREMESLYRELKPLLASNGVDLIAQMRGTSTKSLRDRFLADENLSLFALKSFWEGFDAPGDTLRCVIIVRLPFGRPNDPIALEREVRESRGAWRKYSLPEAVMDLKQAAGRLIRNSTDSGWLVLADARLQTKNYARSFLRAMPTSDIRTCTIEEMARTIENGSPGLP